MGKPVWLKTSAIKYNMTKILFNIFSFSKNNKKIKKADIYFLKFAFFLLNGYNY